MKLEVLGDGYVAYTDGEELLSADGILLADFAQTLSPACDLCAGVGTVALLLSRKGVASVTAVEIDKHAHSLLVRGASASHANIRCICADAKTYKPSERFALVTANPPYFLQSRSPNARRNEIRAQTLITLKDVVSTATAILAPDGRFCFCMTADRAHEAEITVHEFGLYIARRRHVAHSPATAPYLVMLDCVRIPSPEVEDIVYIDSDYYRRLVNPSAL